MSTYLCYCFDCKGLSVLWVVFFGSQMFYVNTVIFIHDSAWELFAHINLSLPFYFFNWSKASFSTTIRDKVCQHIYVIVFWESNILLNWIPPSSSSSMIISHILREDIILHLKATTSMSSLKYDARCFPPTILIKYYLSLNDIKKMSKLRNSSYIQNSVKCLTRLGFWTMLSFIFLGNYGFVCFLEIYHAYLSQLKKWIIYASLCWCPFHVCL